jgi:hypothetical protein
VEAEKLKTKHRPVAGCVTWPVLYVSVLYVYRLWGKAEGSYYMGMVEVKEPIRSLLSLL